MMIALESMAVEMPKVERHPNRAEFRGVLTVVDVASQRPPSGSAGHRVVLTRSAAEVALPSLLGMGLDYTPSFDRHDQRRKVGVITSAEIVGRNLEIGGYLYAKDFPEVVAEIAKWGRRASEAGVRTLEAGDRVEARREGVRLRARLADAVERIRGLRASAREGSRPDRAKTQSTGPLGMSYEVADVSLADRRARVWILTKVTFTGAAILRRDKAVYGETWIELVG